MGGACGKSKNSANQGDDINGDFVLHIIRADDVPRGDMFHESDSFAKLSVRGPDGHVKGVAVKTSTHPDAKSPHWDSYRNLCITPNNRDQLHVEVWDADLVKDDKLAVGDFPISKLVPGKPIQIPLQNTSKSCTNPSNCTITIELMKLPSNYPTKKFFFMRHGESKWNEAQEAKDLGGMLSFDHGLSETGVEQARSFKNRWSQANNKDLSVSEAQLLSIETVFSSPLTRAIETTLLAFQGHKGLQSNGIKLLRSIREVKKIGGLDTVGSATEEIPKRVEKDLTELVGEKEAQQLLVKIDVSNTMSKWWTSDMDNEDEIKERFEDLISTLHYGPFQTAILVGHSLFWRQFFKHFIAFSDSNANGKSVPKEKEELARTMTTKKLENAACVAAEFSFNQQSAKIVDVDSVFGTDFIA